MTAICLRILSTGDPKLAAVDEDCRVFCTTVGFWAPLDVVLLEMTRIAAARDVSTRVEQIIRYWCDKTPRILWEEGANETLLALVEEGVTRINNERGRSLSDHLVKAERKFKALLQNSHGTDTDSIQSFLLLIEALTCRHCRTLRIDGSRSHGKRTTPTSSGRCSRTTFPLPSQVPHRPRPRTRHVPPPRPLCIPTLPQSSRLLTTIPSLPNPTSLHPHPRSRCP